MKYQIILGATIIATAILFQPQLQNALVNNVKAEVGGMGAYELKADPDFKRAVGSIVENCYVYDAEYISC